MLTKGMKRRIENFIMTECDDIIIDIMANKLKVDISRTGDDINFKVTFAGQVVTQDTINIK